MNNTTKYDSKLIQFASQRPFLTALAGSVLFLLSFPPFGFWFLGWLAAIPFVVLIAVPEFEARRPMLKIWMVGLAYWAAETYYIAIPHPALIVAWAMLFSYLSLYPLLFVWIGRKFVHKQGMSAAFAAPIVFTALEWCRAHMLTGFGFSMLSNSQVHSPLLLQVCDIAGGYGLSFLMVAFACGVFLAATNRMKSGVAVSLATLLIVVGYGNFRLYSSESSSNDSIDVALIQGCIDTRFPTTPSEVNAYREQLATDYLKQQIQWQQENDWPVPDLIIWPEGKYPVPHAESQVDSFDQDRKDFSMFHALLYRDLIKNKEWKGTVKLPTMIVGTNTWYEDSAYNSAVLVSPQGFVADSYHKMHLVPFGEFVPFSKWLPVLNKVTPIGSGFLAGKRPKGFRVGEHVAEPFVCFESVVSHLVRESIAYLKASGNEPDFLVNVTDDGWFYGHALLDHHLACNVMRAVENRKPMVVAANTGFSAIIQPDGRVLRQGPRRNTEVIHMDMPIHSMRSIYSVIGDWPAVVMTVICVLAILLPCRKQVVDGDTNDSSSVKRKESNA